MILREIQQLRQFLLLPFHFARENIILNIYLLDLFLFQHGLLLQLPQLHRQIVQFLLVLRQFQMVVTCYEHKMYIPNLVTDLSPPINHLLSSSYRSHKDSSPRATLRNPDSRSSISRNR